MSKNYIPKDCEHCPKIKWLKREYQAYCINYNTAVINGGEKTEEYYLCNGHWQRSKHGTFQKK